MSVYKKIGGGNEIKLLKGKNTGSRGFSIRTPNFPTEAFNEKNLIFYPSTSNYNFFGIELIFQNASNFSIEFAYAGKTSRSSVNNIVVSDDLKTVTFTPFKFTIGDLTITNLKKITIENGCLVIHADSIQRPNNYNSQYVEINSFNLLNYTHYVISVGDIFLGYNNIGDLPLNKEE